MKIFSRIFAPGSKPVNLNQSLLIEFRQREFVVLERQYLIFIVAAAAGFAALLVVGLFFNPLQATPVDIDSGVTKAEIGKTAYVRYSYDVIRLVQGLPVKNILRVEAPSELLSTNLAGLKGEIRYSEMTIRFVQNGKAEEISEKDFKTIQYRFFPDPGNVTSYTYENVEFRALTTSSELVASFVPLSTAKVGQQYPVKMVLEGGPVDIGILEKIIEVVE